MEPKNFQRIFLCKQYSIALFMFCDAIMNNIKKGCTIIVIWINSQRAQQFKQLN